MFYNHLFKLLDIYPNSSIFHNALMKLVHPFLNAESNDIATINKVFLPSVSFFKNKDFYHIFIELFKLITRSGTKVRKNIGPAILVILFQFVSL